MSFDFCNIYLLQHIIQQAYAELAAYQMDLKAVIEQKHCKNITFE